MNPWTLAAWIILALTALVVFFDVVFSFPTKADEFEDDQAYQQWLERQEQRDPHMAEWNRRI